MDICPLFREANSYFFLRAKLRDTVSFEEQIVSKDNEIWEDSSSQMGAFVIITRSVQIADCRLHTRYKMKAADCRLDINID